MFVIQCFPVNSIKLQTKDVAGFNLGVYYIIGVKSQI